VELDTVGLPITPSQKDYTQAIDRLITYVESKQFSGVAKITEALRVEYYKLVKRILDEKDQVIDCYAGWVSAQIYANGTVWPCCVRADILVTSETITRFQGDLVRREIREARRSIAPRNVTARWLTLLYQHAARHTDANPRCAEIIASRR